MESKLFLLTVLALAINSAHGTTVRVSPYLVRGTSEHASTNFDPQKWNGHMTYTKQKYLESAAAVGVKGSRQFDGRDEGT